MKKENKNKNDASILASNGCKVIIIYIFSHRDHKVDTTEKGKQTL